MFIHAGKFPALSFNKKNPPAAELLPLYALSFVFSGLKPVLGHAVGHPFVK